MEMGGKEEGDAGKELAASGAVAVAAKAESAGGEGSRPMTDTDNVRWASSTPRSVDVSDTSRRSDEVRTNAVVEGGEAFAGGDDGGEVPSQTRPMPNSGQKTTDGGSHHPPESFGIRTAIQREENNLRAAQDDDASLPASAEDFLRATQNSLNDAVGAFHIQGPGNLPPTAPSPHQNYTNDNLPPNIDIIAEATLVHTVDGGDDAERSVDTLGLRHDEEANLGGAEPDSASVAMSAITTPYTPTVADPERATVHPAGCEERQEGDTAQLTASTMTPPPNDDGGAPTPIAHAEPMDKMSVYAFGASFRFKTWHLVLLACMALAAVVVPLSVVLPDKIKGDEDGPSKNVAEEQAQDEVEGQDTSPEVAEQGPVLMELPAGTSANEECEYQLYENNSTFRIDSVLLNGESVTTDGNINNEGGTIITAQPGSELRVKGKASTCSSWCPTCLSQLYVSLMDYDGGSLYDPCKYRWAGEVTRTDPIDDLSHPPRDATSKCFDYRMNDHCGKADFDIIFVLDADSYPADSNTRYGIVLSNSYEYLCQEELKKNELNILGVSNEYFLLVEGETISIENVDEVFNDDEAGTEISEEFECNWELHNNTSTFTIDGLYLDDVPVITEEEMEPTITSVSPGDTIRIKGRAATCADGGEGTYAWCPRCWVQLYVSLMRYDEGVSLYDPCEYLWAPQVLFDGEDKEGVDFRGADDEPDLIRPNEDMTSQCIEATRLNGDCTETEFDKEITIGADSSLDGATKYAIVLSASYEYYCQEFLLENRLRVLSVSDDYFVQVEKQQEELQGDGVDSGS